MKKPKTKKECIKCFGFLDRSNFSKQKQNKDGLNYVCKKCKSKNTLVKYYERKSEKLELIKKRTGIEEELKGEEALIYVQSFEEGLYKVGMSNNVIARNEQLKHKILSKERELKILYVGKPLKGNARDAESIAHYDLSKVKEIVTYQDGTRSREWFRCDLDNLIFYLNTCVADMKKYSK